MACRESSPLATCWPLFHADDPWLTPLGLGPSSFLKEGVGAGHRTCAHAPLLLRPHPASAISTSAARSSGDHWLPAAQSHRCLAASVGEGKQTGQSNPFPKSLASCLRLRQSPPPRPQQTMGVSQRDVAAESQPASGKEVAFSPGPRSQPQVRAGSAHVWLQGLYTHPHFHQLAHTAGSGIK